MKELFLICHVIFLTHITAREDSFSTVVPINVHFNSTIKSALRYGFQQTHACLSYQKTFLCIQKCLDLNFDIAFADKNCKCTCHYRKEKAKYTIRHNVTKTNWKLGAPTTSIPPWAQEKKKTKQTDPDNIIDTARDTDNESQEHNVTATSATVSVADGSNNDASTLAEIIAPTVLSGNENTAAVASNETASNGTTSVASATDNITVSNDKANGTSTGQADTEKPGTASAGNATENAGTAGTASIAETVATGSATTALAQGTNDANSTTVKT